MAKIGDISELLLLMGTVDPTDNQRALANFVLNRAESAVIRYLKYDPAMAVRTEYYPNMDFTLNSRASVWEVDDQSAFVRRLSESAVDELQLKHLPIREFDEAGENGIDLRIDYDGRSGTRSGSFAADTQKTAGIDFWANFDTVDSNGHKVCNDGIVRSEGRWPQEPGSVKITYVGGYTQDEFRGEAGAVDAGPILEAVLDESVKRVKKIVSRQNNAKLGLGIGPFSSENLGDYSYSLDTKILSTLVGGDSDLMAESIQKLQPFVNYGAALAS